MSNPSTNWSSTSVPVSVNSGRNVFGRVIANIIETLRVYQRHSSLSSPALLVPPGTITAFVGTSIPGGWLLCDGSEVSRTEYPELFEYIGLRFGVGDGVSTFKLPRMTGPTAFSGDLYVYGETVDKDMTTGLCPELLSEYAPNGVAIISEQSSASYWDDWGNDIFDDFGYFYIFDPNSNSYAFPELTPINQTDGVVYTQSYSAFERNFTITHGYIAQGVFRIEIICTSDSSFTFRFGAYGDMGSDDSTENTNRTQEYTLDNTGYTLYYNRNVEIDDEIERFFTYVVPHQTELNNTKTYSEFLNNDDELSIYTSEVQHGVTVYFAKTNDIKEFVINDLQISDGYIRPGKITLNGSFPSQGFESSYIIKI
jgi:hypothetical protein